MGPQTDSRHVPPLPQPLPAPRPATEPVDLENAEAVTRAIALHQAGKAVFAVPFGSVGSGTLTWLDPRTQDAPGSTSSRG
jgi:hypothetical protein